MRGGLAGRASRWAAWGTAATVAGVISGWLVWVQLAGHRYEALVLVVLAVVGVAVSALVTRTLAGSSLDRVRDMTARVRELEEESWLGELGDPELAELAHAFNEVLRSVREEHGEVAAEVERVHSLLEVSPNGVLATDAEGRIRYINPSLGRFIPLRGDEILGRLPIEVVPVAEVQEAVDTALGGEEVEGLHCECGPYDLLIKAVPSGDAGVVLLVHDVTTFRSAERTRTDFVSNVSHELRTPIATVMGYAETLLDDRDRLDDDIQPLVDAIYRNARRLSELFEDLLHLSRIEARRGDLPLELVPLVPILEEAVLSAADQASRKAQTFSLECEQGLQARVNTEAFEAIIGNLAGNAVKYTPPGGRVRVAATQAEDGGVIVEVEDDGVGIDKVHHDRIFERFYRVDQGRSRRVGGTGLGLAIAKHLALATGCHIEVRSDPGSGSLFVLHVPGEDP